MDSEWVLALGLLGCLILFLFINLFLLGWISASDHYGVGVFKGMKHGINREHK